MRVSHADDFVSHAILGGGEGRDFGISDDPAFFQILSSTLYSNQPLAVVRETLCNGWDAHIEAGKTDVPLKITLTEDELIIRDFGSGISDEDMGPIYGVYGGSTKKRKKNVTGGFGLGCKAPFSYSDHFEVTSWHGGRKTIYNLSRSSAEVEGKPGIFPIASFTTDETGLQVSIPLKKHDRSKFYNLICEVVRNGEILADLNDQRLKVLPFSKAKLGALFVGSVFNQSTVNVRLGNVIYPLNGNESEKLYSAYIRACRFAEENFAERRCVIFQAEPDTLSITPSRESLSMTEQTVEALNKLINSTLDKIESEVEKLTPIMEKELYNRVEKEASLSDLFDISIDLRTSSTKNASGIFVSAEDIVLGKFQRKYKFIYGYTPPYEELVLRSRALENKRIFHRETIRSYRKSLILGKRAYRKAKAPWKFNSNTAINMWFWSQLVQPIRSELEKRSLPVSRLSFISKITTYVDKIETETLDRPGIYINCAEGFKFLRRYVVITFNKKDLLERLPKFPQFRKFGDCQSVFVYTVPRTFTRIGKVREALQAAGMTVLDMTVSQPWEDDDVVVPITREKRDVQKGLPILSCLVDDKDSVKVPDDPACSKEVTLREELPTYVVKLSRGTTVNGENLPDGLNMESFRIAIRLLGDKIGVTISSTQKESYVSKGSIPLEKALVDLVLEEYKKNKRIRAHLKRDFTRTDDIRRNTDFRTILYLAERQPELQRQLKMVSSLTERDWDIITLGRSLRNYYYYSYDSEKKEVYSKFMDVLKRNPLNKEFCNRIKQLSNNSMFNIIKSNTIYDYLNSKAKEEMAPKILAILKIILKG